MKNINRSEVHKVSEEKLKALRTELAEFKLLEVSLGKRIKNLVSDVNEHEAELAELKTENNMFIEFINRTFGKDADGIIEDLRELKPYKENQYE